MTEIVRDPEHSNEAPTIEGTGIRIIAIAKASGHSSQSPNEIVVLYPDLSPSAIHTALAFYDDRMDEFRSTSWLAATSSAFSSATSWPTGLSAS